MSTAFACDMTAIPPAERGAHQALTRRMIAAAITIRESDDGFVLELSKEQYDVVTGFVARERLCCPFLTFVVTVQAAPPEVELRIWGPAGAKEFIRAELRL